MDKKYELTEDEIVNKVIERLSTRSDIGVKKYNTTLQDSPQSHKEFIVHLIEELADGLNYGEKLLSMFDDMENNIKSDLLSQLYSGHHITTQTFDKFSK